MTSADNVKNQVLDKLGLSTPEKQKQDTSYLDGLQGLLNSKKRPAVGPEYARQ
ncbi:putative outer membrane protein [Klebsiella pneumoniae subsp. rhinoscleromatis]|nr:putative outer membrane protein [Klebsiella pneumoniae subsp. rhinoscleromatis]